MVISTQPVAVDVDRFVFLFDANPANGDPLRLHCGIYRKFHWSIRDYVGYTCRENETTAGYDGTLQKATSIDA